MEGDISIMTVDNRVVHLGFDNEQFERGVSTSTKSLDNLKKGLNFEGSTRGLQSLSEASRGFSLNNIADSVNSVSSKFSAFGVVAFTVLQNITNAAINAGQKILNALALDPLKKGYQEYETQINAIQTILANTESKGTTIRDVNAALDELNAYSDKTIYNFTEMAKNIGTFTAAGVDLDTSVSAIKGIANLAAVSGSTSQQAAVAMYQLSQALASGTVKLMDWNSVVNAGMGGEVFKNALSETARVHGIAIDEMIEKEGGFRNTLQNGWLTTEILTETLSKFTGDLNAEQLKTMGYSEEQIAAVLKLGQTANDAATKVKTMSQLFDTLKEAAQSGWAQTWRIIVGDFLEARKFFTNMSDLLSGLVNESSDARNALLQGWKDLGGRTLLLQSVENILTGLVTILKTIGEAFSEIFPPLAVKDLMNFTHLVHTMSLNFKMADGTIQKIKTSFKGLAALFDIGGMAVSVLVKEIFRLFKLIPLTGDGVLSFTANIGDYLIKLRDTIKTTDIFTTSLQKFKDFIKKITGDFLNFIQPFVDIQSAFVNGFNAYSNIDMQGMDKFIAGFKAKMAKLNSIKDFVKSIISGIGSTVKKLEPFFKGLSKTTGEVLGKLSTAISDAFANFDFDRFFQFINTGLLTVLVTSVSGFFNKGSKVFKNIQPFEGINGVLKSFSSVLDTVRGSLEVWQQNIKSEVIMRMAVALGILTVAILVLSQIDPGKLAGAMAALTAMFGELLGTMAILDKIPSMKDLGSSIIGMIGLSVAVLILSAAVKTLGELETSTLIKGVAAVAALGAGLGLFATVMKSKTPDMIKASIGLIFLSVAIRLLTGSIAKLGEMELSVLQQGLSDLALILASLAAFVNITKGGKNLISVGIGIALMGVAMHILISAMQKMADMSWETLGKGLSLMAGSLVTIGLAMRLMPNNMLAVSISLVIVAQAITMLATAIKMMGGMSLEEIGKGLGTLALALVILAVGLKFISSSLAGVAVLIVAAAAIYILGAALKMIGSLPIKSIAIALGAIAATILILGLAALAIGPVLPVLMAFTASLLLFGLAALAAGAGIMLLGLGLTAIAAAGSAAALVFITIVTQIIALLPTIGTKVGEMIVNFVTALKNGLPLLLSAFSEMILGLVTTIITLTPKIIEAAVVMITELLNAIIILAPKFMEAGVVVLTALINGAVSLIPTLVQAGFDLLISLLTGIRDNIQEVVTVAIDVVIKFIDGIASKIPDVIESAYNLLLSFIEGLTAAIDTYMPKINAAVGKLVKAIIDGLVDGITGGAKSVGNALANLGLAALNALKAALGIESPSKETAAVGRYMGQGLVDGLNNMLSSVKKSAENLGKESLNSLTEVVSTIADAISSDLDLSPTIRPVVDLTDVKIGGERIGSLLGFSNIKLAGSVNRVSGISKELGGVYNEKNGLVNPADKDVLITFTQNNYSPEALSNAEIYRLTRNQLSRMKGLLGVA